MVTFRTEDVAAQEVRMGLDMTLENSGKEDDIPISAVFDEYFKRVFTYIRYRCNEDALADDLTAQTFERVMTRIGEYDPERGQFASWLFGIARNAVNDHFQTARRFPWPGHLTGGKSSFRLSMVALTRQT